MKTKKNLPSLLPLLLTFLAPSAHALVEENSPPILIGQIVSSSKTDVKLKLDDGRKEISIPKKYVSIGNGGFRKGLILRVNVTAELLRALGTEDSPKNSGSSAADGKLVDQILLLQSLSTQSLDVAAKNPLLDFFTVRESFAAIANCAPISMSGELLNSAESQKQSKCFYGRFNKAASCGRASQTELYQVCNPLVYGESVCSTSELVRSTVSSGGGTSRSKTEYELKKSCDAAFKTRCSGQKLSDADCVRTHVIAYVKDHAKEFDDYVNNLFALCNDSTNSAVSQKICQSKVGALAALEHIKKLRKEYAEENKKQSTIKGCELDLHDTMNIDLSSTYRPTFSTVDIPGCANGTVCIRQVKCLVSLVPNEPPRSLPRYARCLQKNCNTAAGCLNDTMVTGSSSKSDLSNSGAVGH